MAGPGGGPRRRDRTGLSAAVAPLSRGRNGMPAGRRRELPQGRRAFFSPPPFRAMVQARVPARA
jgi:hypothetical protein